MSEAISLQQLARASRRRCGFSAALLQGLAPDGGLYVPLQLAAADARGLRRRRASSPQVADAAARAVPGAGSRSRRSCRPSRARRSTFPRRSCRSSADGAAGGARAVPRARRRPSRTSARAFSPPASRACAARAARPLTILVATSGDTGGAVAAAFHERPGIEVAVLFPKGLVSPTQERQLTCWGGNVTLAARARHVRRLPAPGEGSLPRSAARARAVRCPPPTASTSGGCCRRACTTPRPASPCGARTASAPPSSCRAAISATRSPACGRARSGCRSATWCWRTMPTARCRTTSRAGCGSRGRASRRSPRPWTSAIRATWSACARCSRSSTSCAPR